MNPSLETVTHQTNLTCVELFCALAQRNNRQMEQLCKDSGSLKVVKNEAR